jgi:hypothetical protein
MKSIGQVLGARIDGRAIVDHDLDRRRPAEVTTGVLSVVIPYTTMEHTQAAIRHVGVCSDLDVHVTLVDVQVVPFPCPLDQPPIDSKYSRSRLAALFSETSLPGRGVVLYARDWLEGIRRALEPQSLIVMATRRRWWPTREEKLARSLSKAGYQVMLLSVR